MPTRKKIESSVHALALSRLQESLLNLDDAKTLGIDILDAATVAGLGASFERSPALRLNYFGPDGKALSDWPKHPPFFRLRYLAKPAGFHLVTGEKPQRYAQAPGTACCAYFPKGLVDWPQVIQDPQSPLIITEGELKAACACKHEMPAVGLGGVHSWRSHLKGVFFLPELERINWVGRNVYLCFDSDTNTNPKVLGALRQLAGVLHEQGAYALVATMPSLGEDKKTGLDDFIAAEGAEAFRRLLHIATPLGFTRTLFRFNETYCYVAQPGLVMEVDKLTRIPTSTFKEIEAPQKYVDRILLNSGEVAEKPIAAADAWIRWPLRRQAAKLVYEPGQVRQTGEAFNLWPGWGVEPKAGDAKPFLKLLDHLFTGAEPEALRWFLCWCAAPLQNPGLKVFSSAVFFGTRHGTGKSLVGYTLGKIYGKNFTEINERDLHAGFNEWAENKQFVMGDDVSGSDKRSDNDLLKKLVTQQELRVNAKYLPTYTIQDCINYYFTSNHPDAFFLQDDDRRFFIHEVSVGPMDGKFYAAYKAWLKDGGASAVFHYLLHLDLKGFDPSAAALKTRARDLMIADGKSDIGAWVRRLVESPDLVLKVGEVALKKDLYLSRELLPLYDPLERLRVTSVGLGRELRRAGIPLARGGALIQGPDGMGRYFILRNREKWLKAELRDIQAHLLSEGAETKGAKF